MFLCKLVFLEIFQKNYLLFLRFHYILFIFVAIKLQRQFNCFWNIGQISTWILLMSYRLFLLEFQSLHIAYVWFPHSLEKIGECIRWSLLILNTFSAQIKKKYLEKIFLFFFLFFNNILTIFMHINICIEITNH